MKANLHKIVIRMSKLCVYAMLLSQSLVMAMASETVAQRQFLKEINIELQFTNQESQVLDLAGLINEIEETTGFNFAYSKRDIKGQNIQLSKSSYDLRSLLEEISTQGKFSIKRVNETVTLIPVKGLVEKLPDLNEELIVQTSVSGTITDENGEALPGATIQEKGTTNGTITDVEGKFSLNVSQDGVLTVSFVGYQSQEIVVNNRSIIDVKMAVDSEQLEEVVVVGYGTQKKSHLTAAVDQVAGETLQNRPLKSVAEGLQGLVAGLNIQAPSGAPEAELDLNIRGFTGFGTSGAPLILVDGIERRISDINPNDVESVSVLKDGAASAIYGSRAPFGIVMITTKQGGKNESIKVDYSVNYRLGSPINTPEQLNSYEWAERVNEAYRNQPGGGTQGWFSDMQIDRMKAYAEGDYDNPVFDGLDPAEVPYGTYTFTPTQWGGHQQAFANVKWFEESLKSVVPSQQHNLSVSGGGSRSAYYVGLGFNESNGIFKGITDFKDRYSILSKVNSSITDWLSYSISANYVRTNEKGPNVFGNGRNYSIIWDALARSFQNWPTINPNGTYYRFNNKTNFQGVSGAEYVTRNDLTWTGSATIKPFEGMEITGRYTWRYNTNNFTRTQFVVKQVLPNGDEVSTQRSPATSSLIRNWQNTNYHTVDIHASYTKSLGKNNFFILAGYQEENNLFEQLSAEGRNLVSTEVATLSTSAEIFTADDRLFDWSTRGFFGRLSYNYDEKYLVEFNGRRDATSRFAASDRWGFFPSVSAAWNVARESFWPIEDIVSEFKVRSSWASSGNAEVDLNGNNVIDDYEYYLSHPTIPITTSSGTIIDGVFVNQAGLPNLVNSQLTWAKPRTIGFGVDFDAFNSRLELSYDWYQRTVEDQFGPANPLPEVLGATVPLSNNAVSETRGWEYSIKWRDQAAEFMGKPIRYRVQFRMSDYIGYVVKYEHNGTGSRSNQWIPGQVFGQNFFYESAGIMQNDEELYQNVPKGSNWFYQGDIAIKDLNGDGQINMGEGDVWYAEGDRVKNGFNYPRYRYGITLGVDWNGFDLTAFLDGVGHWKTYSTSQYIFGTATVHWYTAWFKEHEELDAWTPDNPDAFFPRLMYDAKNRSSPNDQYALDLSHLRIRNIQLGYTLGQNLLNKIKLRKLNVYVSAENLGFIYYNSFIKYDPQLIGGASGQGYPPQRVISFGLNVGI